MPDRARLLAGVGVAALLAGAVVLMRTPSDDTASRVDERPSPAQVVRYAADSVVLPAPDEPPPAPEGVRVTPGPSWQTISWTGSAPGYEVRWPGGARLVTEPEIRLDQMGEGIPVSVRAVSAFGRYSPAVSVAGAAFDPDFPWRSGLTGLFDDFSDDRTFNPAILGSRWHLSGYRGCVDLGKPRVGLAVELSCGSDIAVLRARAPMRLVGGAGRVAVLTDAAGPGGLLTVDLVPGPADRIGAGAVGAVRAELGDQARVLPGGEPARPPSRGVGVLHLVEVVVAADGVRLLVDGRIAAFSPVAPTWSQAHVLVGLRGPVGRQARVHVAAAGFSGPAVPVPPVVEVPVNVATRQVLDPAAHAPALGIARGPLAAAKAARVVVTVGAPAGIDLARAVVQLGGARLPARLAAPVRPGRGAVATVIADVPSELLGPGGPDSLSPLAVRAPGAGPGATVLESYLEIEPATAAAFPDQPLRGVGGAQPDALPQTRVVLGDSAGTPLAEPSVRAGSRLVLGITLDGRAAQWDSGSLAGVAGFEVRVDGRLVAAVPTAIDGPAPGGRYTVALALGGMQAGEHVLETKVLGADGSSSSTLTRFTIT
ncbi:hypothetical protein [Actinokineospora sp. NPDC004072]